MSITFKYIVFYQKPMSQNQTTITTSSVSKIAIVILALVFGFGLFVLSVLFNSLFSNEFSANMKIGQELTYEKEKIKFLKIKTKDKKIINPL